jgi:hypothetical protein
LKPLDCVRQLQIIG